jgi:hypothetical protein
VRPLVRGDPPPDRRRVAYRSSPTADYRAPAVRCNNTGAAATRTAQTVPEIHDIPPRPSYDDRARPVPAEFELDGTPLEFAAVPGAALGFLMARRESDTGDSGGGDTVRRGRNPQRLRYRLPGFAQARAPRALSY